MGIFCIESSKLYTTSTNFGFVLLLPALHQQFIEFLSSLIIANIACHRGQALNVSYITDQLIDWLKLDQKPFKRHPLM